MNINKYVKETEVTNEGMWVTLIDDSRHLLTNSNRFSNHILNDYIKSNFKIHETKTFEGWLGGDYEKLGFYDTQKDADRGHVGGEYLTDLFEEFKGKKVSIKITELD